MRGKEEDFLPLTQGFARLQEPSRLRVGVSFSISHYFFNSKIVVRLYAFFPVPCTFTTPQKKHNPLGTTKKSVIYDVISQKQQCLVFLYRLRQSIISEITENMNPSKIPKRRPLLSILGDANQENHKSLLEAFALYKRQENLQCLPSSLEILNKKGDAKSIISPVSKMDKKILRRLHNQIQTFFGVWKEEVTSDWSEEKVRQCMSRTIEGEYASQCGVSALER